jgi:hypothetical protein
VVCSLDPDSLASLSVLEPGHFAVRWTRDGRGLYVFSEDGRSGSLELLDLVTGRYTPVRAIGSDDPAGLIHFGPMLVTPDGSAYAYNYFRILSDLYVVEGLK